MRTSPYFKIVVMTVVITLLVVGLIITHPLESQGTTPFLSPPYFGQANVSAIFDHEFPVYCGWYPTPPPAPTPPITPDPYYCRELRYVPLSTPPIPTQYEVAHTMIHNDGQRVSQDANPDLGYSGHSGVDYTFGYDYVLATHSGVVIEADWDNPDDSSDGYGLHVRLRATDGIHTSIYGHLSTLLTNLSLEFSWD